MTELTRSALAARSGVDTSAAPARLVHLGVGHFHRAHQAAYTDRAVDAAEWGIAAFTGRTAGVARVLERQDGLYTLITRGPAHDEATIVRSISAAHDGNDVRQLVNAIAAPATAVITMTVTEASYRLDHRGELRRDDPDLASDRELIVGAVARADLLPADSPITPLGRLAIGLEARRRADAGPLTVLPCDNLLSGGTLVRDALDTFAGWVSPALESFVRDHVSVAATSVDRITPSGIADAGEIARALVGFDDAAPVVAEPYSSWVISGSFPAGRPCWETAGAEFVDDVRPYELRKLWLLNGAHSLLAYAGLVRGHETVAAALRDPVIREWIDELWDDVVAVLPGAFDRASLDGYRATLLQRFSNSRLDDALVRIAADGAAKLRARVAPVVLAHRERGDAPIGGWRLLAGWIAAARAGLLTNDREFGRIHQSRGSATRLLEIIDPALAGDEDTVAHVELLAQDISQKDRRTSDGGTR